LREVTEIKQNGAMSLDVEASSRDHEKTVKEYSSLLKKKSIVKESR